MSNKMALDALTGLTDMGWVIDAARSQAKEGDQHG